LDQLYDISEDKDDFLIYSVLSIRLDFKFC